MGILSPLSLPLSPFFKPVRTSPSLPPIPSSISPSTHLYGHSSPLVHSPLTQNKHICEVCSSCSRVLSSLASSAGHWVPGPFQLDPPGSVLPVMASWRYTEYRGMNKSMQEYRKICKSIEEYAREYKNI